MKLVSLCVVLVACFGCSKQPVVIKVQPRIPTKNEWRAACEKLELSHSHKGSIGGGVSFDSIPVEEVYKKIGKPFRTQKIGSNRFWYWQCSDGIIQVEITQETTKDGKQRVWFSCTNDY